MTRSHAYLIVAHDNAYVLGRLLSMIDDKRSAVYIHLDKGFADADEASIANACTESSVSFIERRDVTWGHFSIVEVVLELLRSALAHEHDYYHLLSGSDLALQTPDHIYDFFETHDGNEFIGFAREYDERWATELQLFPQYARPKNLLQRLTRRLLHRNFVRLQRAIRYDHSARFDMVVKKGSDWYSISHALASHLLASEQLIRKFFGRSHSASELFVHTIVWNSDFRDKVHNLSDEFAGSLRHIDWERGIPYVFRAGDFDELSTSDRLFARKFRADVDQEIVDMMSDEVASRRTRRA